LYALFSIIYFGYSSATTVEIDQELIDRITVIYTLPRLADTNRVFFSIFITSAHI